MGRRGMPLWQRQGYTWPWWIIPGPFQTLRRMLQTQTTSTIPPIGQAGEADIIRLASFLISSRPYCIRC